MAFKLSTKPDYGIDAPAVMRNMFLGAAIGFFLVVFAPPSFTVGQVTVLWHRPVAIASGFAFVEGCLFLLYVKLGKFRHRDFMLGMHAWRGDEKVLDVGCGRGLLLAGVAKRLTTGHATGLDVWSNVDMGGNSEVATLHNLGLEAITDRCTLVSAGAQEMPFVDGSFDVVVSNLCVHNIYDKPTRLKALDEIGRVLKPGGLVLLSDYKRTGEYAQHFRDRGFTVETRWGSFVTTFPPLRVVIARKPLS